MTALIFDTCCGCIELRTGCLIIGYLNLVYSIIYVIATLAIGLVVTVSSQEIKDELDKNHMDATALSIVAIITIVIILLYLILNIVFLVGVHQNKRGHVRVYLILNVIFLVIYVLNFFASLAGIVTWSGVLQSLIIIALNAYFLLVIRSFYYKMDSTSHQPAIFNTA